MRLFRKLLLRLRSLFRRAAVERELNEELRFHLEERIEERTTRGMALEEARYAALRELAAWSRSRRSAGTCDA
jgi:putative ABC transport system permease protein